MLKPLFFPFIFSSVYAIVQSYVYMVVLTVREDRKNPFQRSNYLQRYFKEK